MRTLLSSLLALSLTTLAACGDDIKAGPSDAGPIDAGATPDASCFENPTTNEEIINACTDADKVYKVNVLPLLNPDGTLPALP